MEKLFSRTKKILQTLSICREASRSCRLSIMNIEKVIRLNHKEFGCISFVEPSMAHLLKKNSRFYHKLKPRYMPNKKCCEHLANPV